ncbi:MAG TPA: efflux RND transporter periplasmic adaptor subunit [Pyrinomonadaceae bacterium]|nr:efflux RND transporter periplasmic adaptor subunit [Pyrinomonadaceae bacterium]
MNILHLRNLAVVPGALVLAFAAAACSSKGGEKQGNTPPPPTVIVAEVTQKTVPIYSEFVGQTKAEETVELRARVEGVLQKVYFREGTPVRKGQLLFTIDKRPFEAALQSARALAVKAASDLAQAQQRTDVLQAQAELADAQAVLTRADQDVNRLAPLAKEKAVTEQDLDAAIATQKSARATVDSRKANLTNLEAAVKYTIERARAEVAASQARVTQAQLDLSYCDIYAPLNGVIGFLQVDEGNLVGRGDATLLATISASDPLLVDFNVSEIEYLKLTDPETAGKNAADLSFDLMLSDESIHPHQGKFRVLDRSVDPATGTLKAEAAFPNPGSYLRPGQFARLRVAVAQRENAILIPQRAVQELQGAKTVMVVDNENKVSVRTVKLGDKSDKDVVVLDGLSGGERVIVEGMQKVRPGGQVNPSTGNQQAASTQH